jgi:hypothetical protein
MLGRLAMVALLLSAWPIRAARAEAAADSTVWLPVVVHVAQVAGKPVAPPAFIAERIARANQIFAAYGVGFTVTRAIVLAESHARLESRADRDALAADAQRGVIDCFVVESLRDVDEPERVRRGVHWRSTTRRGAHFVIVSVIGGVDVLAHELGHFLGNPEHSDTPGNLMSYQRGDGLPFLDTRQVARFRRALHHYLQRGELRALSKPRAP